MLKEIFEEKMSEIFPNLMKTINITNTPIINVKDQMLSKA